MTFRNASPRGFIRKTFSLLALLRILRYQRIKYLCAWLSLKHSVDATNKRSRRRTKACKKQHELNDAFFGYRKKPGRCFQVISFIRFPFLFFFLLPSQKANVLTISCVHPKDRLCFCGAPRRVVFFSFRCCRVNWS